MHVSVIVVRSLADELRRRHVDYRRGLASAGIEPELLDDPAARVSFDVYNRFVAFALEVTDDPQLGLYVGAHAPASALTVIGSLVLASGTLRDAGAVLLRYSDLIVEGTRWSLTHDDRVVSLAVELSDGFEHRAYDHEACLALVYGVIRPFGDDDVPREVCFRHPPTGPIDVYRRVFDCTPTFEVNENAIRGSTWILDRRQPHNDATLSAILRQRADAMLAALQAPDRLPFRIRSFVRAHPSPISVDTEILSSALGLSRRTLRRRLSDRGMNVRDVIQDTLREMACEALDHSHIAVKEIAHRLGFADVSSFHRAFKRWTGRTPVDYRTGAPSSRQGTDRRP